MQTTYTERLELAQELTPLVKAEMAKEAKNVTDVEIVTSTKNVVTLPAPLLSLGSAKYLYTIFLALAVVI